MAESDQMQDVRVEDPTEEAELAPAAVDTSEAPQAWWHHSWGAVDTKMKKSQLRAETLFEKQSGRLASLQQRLGGEAQRSARALRAAHNEVETINAGRRKDMNRVEEGLHDLA